MLPITFNNYAEGDGIAISIDGIAWYRVIDLTGGTSASSYDSFSVSLDSAINDINLSYFANLSFTSDFRVRFQQAAKHS